MATTLSIVLPDELAERLKEAGIPREEASRYALEALSEAADSAEVRAWWDSLTSEQREAERARTSQSLAQADSGDLHPAADVFARIRRSAG